MAVCDLELEGGVSAHIYLSWLHPEKTAKVIVVGRDRMLAYEGRFEKRGITLYDYTIDRDAPARGRGGGRRSCPSRDFAARPLEVPGRRRAARARRRALRRLHPHRAPSRSPAARARCGSSRSWRRPSMRPPRGGTRELARAIGPPRERPPPRSAPCVALRVGGLHCSSLARLRHTGIEPVWRTAARARLARAARPPPLPRSSPSLDALGWRCTLPPAAAARVPLLGLFLTRMAGEAVNSVTPTAAVGGEPVKAYLLRRWRRRRRRDGARVGGDRQDRADASRRASSSVLGVAALLVAARPAAARDRLAGRCSDRRLRSAFTAAARLGAAPQPGHRRSGAGSAASLPRAGFVARLEARACTAIDERLARVLPRRARRLPATPTLLHFVGWLLGVVEVSLMRHADRRVGLLARRLHHRDAVAADPRRGARHSRRASARRSWAASWLCDLPRHARGRGGHALAAEARPRALLRRRRASPTWRTHGGAARSEPAA